MREQVISRVCENAAFKAIECEDIGRACADPAPYSIVGVQAAEIKRLKDVQTTLLEALKNCLVAVKNNDPEAYGAAKRAIAKAGGCQ